MHEYVNQRMIFDTQEYIFRARAHAHELQRQILLSLKRFNRWQVYTRVGNFYAFLGKPGMVIRFILEPRGRRYGGYGWKINVHVHVSYRKFERERAYASFQQVHAHDFKRSAWAELNPGGTIASKSQELLALIKYE